MQEPRGEENMSYSFLFWTVNGVNGQSRLGRALPLGKGPPVPIGQEARWAPEPVWTQMIGEKILCPCRESNPDRPVLQSVVKHYTA
jgi:hypothetical protein